MAKTIDFDAFRAERDQEPIDFKIDGQIYKMSPSMPAAIAVELSAMQLKANIDEEDDVPLELLDKIGIAVFGTDTWHDLLDVHRIGIDELPDLIQLVIGAYNPKPADPPTAST